MSEDVKDVIEKWGKCPLCDGKGWFHDPVCKDPEVLTLCDLCKHDGKIKISSDMKICGKCKGKGRVIIQQRTPFGIQQGLAECDRCKGKCIILKENDK